MVKGGSRAKVNHTRGGKKGREECGEGNEVEVNPEDERAGSDEEDEEAESGEEEKPKPTEQLVKEKKKAPRSILARDDDLEAELAAQFNTGGLTRKQREELEKQEEERKAEQAIKSGETDEAKADLERLAEIRRKREEVKEKAKADAEKASAKEAEGKEREEKKNEVTTKQKAVAEQVAKFAAAGKDGKVTLNFLNQDAACKKVLKPLCKKEGVKAINKAWLSQFPKVLTITEEGKDLVISAKS